MTSAINPLNPVAGTPTTASVRANFAAAKSEIEILQRQIGYADYNDTATTGSPIAVSPSTWTKLTNNKLGANTRSRLPVGVTNLWNSTTNQMDLTELPVDTMIEARMDISVTTTAANQILKIRASFAIGDAIAFQLEASEMQFKTAGAHKIVQSGSFYIGSDPVKNNPAEFQLWSDAACTVVVNGWYFKVDKYLG